MEPVTRIVVAHESPLLRDCLASVLSDDARMQAVGYHPMDEDWSACFSPVGPDVLVVGLGLSGKVVTRIIAAARRAAPNVAVVALLAEFNERDFFDVVAAGVTVCISERASLDELRTAIDRARRGQSYCSPLIANSVLAQLGEIVQSVDWAARAADAVLSAREFEVLRLIADGNLSNKQIASRLRISLYTVKNHIHNILEKLSVDDRHAAAEYARVRAWI